jgi:phenylalanyl-tRNA synthetase alpha chain
VSTELLRGLDPAWSAADPSRFVPEHPQRLAELRELGGDLAVLYARGAEVLAGAPDAASLHERHVALLGRERGVVTLLLAELPRLPDAEKRLRGRGLNLVKRWLLEIDDARREELQAEAESRAARALDVTVPGRRPWVGRPHVLAQTYQELLDVAHGLGFSIYESPEVESDWFNFGSLNFPPDHPAREIHDTYFLESGLLLRTHTSPGWVRAMMEEPPPLRLVFPGRVYRAEAVDATHSDQFHQLDGLFVAEGVSMADLRGTLAALVRGAFGEHVRTRVRPSYFPFVEPGAELDFSCFRCEGSGRLRDGAGDRRCNVCKGTGWIEGLGAGMVHPFTLRAVGYDPEKVSGFAFGMGVDRFAMLRHDIPEIRLLFENDVRFLRQF